MHNHLGPVVQSVVSLMSWLRVISLTVLADSLYNILIFFAENSAKNFSIFVYHSDVNFNESLTNDIVSFEQLGPEHLNHTNNPLYRNNPNYWDRQA